VALDDAVVVVRKEVRHLSIYEQLRAAAAYAKMRENDLDASGNEINGSSQYFRLSVAHGGLAPLPHDKYPEYCAHRRECFPNWHRPYLLDFERTMRRADIALGRDGNISLPYWDWSIVEHPGMWGTAVSEPVVAAMAGLSGLAKLEAGIAAAKDTPQANGSVPYETPGNVEV
jgi:hypothetical protein